MNKDVYESMFKELGKETDYKDMADEMKKLVDDKIKDAFKIAEGKER